MALGQVDPQETCELLERVRSGDQQALDMLLNEHRPAMVRFVTARLDRRLRGRLDASDVVQDAFAEAVRRLTDFLNDRPMPFRLWLRKTTYERLLMQYRRHLGAARRSVEREVMLSEDSALVAAGAIVADCSTPSNARQRQETADRLKAALAELNCVDREIIIMRSIDELAYDEIGCLLGIATAAARKRHGRALLRLADFLKKHGLAESDV